MSINGKYSKTFGIINIETGEITTTDESFTVIGDDLRRLLAMQAKPTSGEYEQDLQEFGNFFWGMYEINEPYLNDLNSATISRLIYLATFLSYSGSLVHDIGNVRTVHGKRFVERQPLSKNDIEGVMKLSDRTFYEFWDEVTSNGIVYEEGGVYYINRKYFSRGHMQRKYLTDDSDIYATKFYISAIRNLYQSATPASHKTLSYIFKLIPYVNRRYNIVCKNPKEVNINNLVKMTLGDYCEILGYGRTHAGRMFATLFEPEFKTLDGKIAPVIRYVVAKKKSDKSSYYMFINPRVYYGGYTSQDVKTLGAF